MTYDKSHRALGAESGRRQESLIPTNVFFAVCQCRLYPLTYSSICPHVHLSAHPPTDPLTQPSICHLPAHSPTHLPTLIYPFFHRPTHPSTHSSICLHIHLPTYTSMSPFPFSSSHLSVHLPPIHLLVLPSIHPLTHQSCIHSLINSPTLPFSKAIHISIFSSTHPSPHPSIHPSPPLSTIYNLSIHPPIYNPSFYPSVHPSIHLPSTHPVT